MRIAFDYQIFTFQVYGGISRYFTRLIEEIASQNHDVCVFAPFYRSVHLKNLPNEVVHGQFCTRFRRAGRVLGYYNRVVGGIQARAWKPDILHETYYMRNRIVSVGRPTVITVYDMIHELFSKMMSPRDRTSSIKRVAIERADHIVCISENTRRDLVRLFRIPENKTSVVYLGFERFIRNDHPVLSPLGKVERPYILYVGDRWSYKNFSTFIEAYAQSKALKSDFDIVAFGGAPFSTDERTFFQELTLDSRRIHHVGGDDGLLGEFYSNARALIYPSLYEGFGLPPLEAMAHNCPVISSNTSSMPEVIGDAASYFDPYNTDEMLTAIESVVYDDELRNVLIEKGQKRLCLFSWKRCADETLSVYQKVLRG